MMTASNLGAIAETIARRVEIRSAHLRDLGTAPAHQQHTRWWADRRTKMARVNETIVWLKATMK
jgi:hypothetical protein